LNISACILFSLCNNSLSILFNTTGLPLCIGSAGSTARTYACKIVLYAKLSYTSSPNLILKTLLDGFRNTNNWKVMTMATATASAVENFAVRRMGGSKWVSW
jgi:hypothetical protein